MLQGAFESLTEGLGIGGLLSGLTGGLIGSQPAAARAPAPAPAFQPLQLPAPAGSAPPPPAPVGSGGQLQTANEAIAGEVQRRQQAMQAAIPGSQQQGGDDYRMMNLPELMLEMKKHNPHLRFSQNEALDPGKKMGGHAPQSWHYEKDENGKLSKAVDVGLTGINKTTKENYDTIDLGRYGQLMSQLGQRGRMSGLFAESIGDGPGHSGANAHWHAAFDGRVPVNGAMARWLALGEGKQPYAFERLKKS